MTPSLVQLVQTGAKLSAPVRLLITLVKSPAGAVVQRFRKVVPANSKLSGHHPWKTVHHRTSGQFSANYQYLGWCTQFCTSLHQLHRGTDRCAHR
jgi:hypothetical protein